MSRSSSPGRWSRIIVHADMDAFYAAVEQLDRPELRGKPLLIGGTGPRSVVATASYEARPFGVGSAMPMGLALRKCPQAIVVPPRLARYAEVSDRIMGVFATFSPLVEALSLDEAFLDLTGAEGLFGPPDEMARRIKVAVREATGLTVSVGVAPNKYVAKVASDIRKPDGLCVVPPDGVRAFLDPLPVSRLWGVGKHGEERLQDMGLRTLADVAAADPAWLERRLGLMGPHVHALAQGIDQRPVVPDREAKSIGSEVTLDDDVVGRAAITPHLLREADRVGRRLRRAGLRAGGVRVKLKTTTFQLLTRQTALHPPTSSGDVLYREALRLLDAFDLGVPMRLIGLAAYDLADAAAPVQGELFGQEGRERQQRLDQAVDALRSRFGNTAVRRGSEMEEEGPERQPDRMRD
ncbi:MAG: DNA polymerase IV [Myxococcota bacterium]